MKSFGERVKNEDIRLFDPIETLLSEADKKSFLAIQHAVRVSKKTYTYLEIGSYKGGSLQTFLSDPKCTKVYSVDKRPRFEPDERGERHIYWNNTTEGMAKLLRAHFPHFEKKLTIIEADTQDIDPREIAIKPDLCFIDAEHTDRAVYNDFLFCVTVSKPSSIFIFHDAHMIFSGIYKCCEYLKKKKIPYYAYILPSTVMVIELSSSSVHKSHAISRRLLSSFEGYHYGLSQLDVYRQAYKKYFRNFLVSFVVRAIGKLRARQYGRET